MTDDQYNAIMLAIQGVHMRISGLEFMVGQLMGKMQLQQSAGGAMANPMFCQNCGAYQPYGICPQCAARKAQ